MRHATRRLAACVVLAVATTPAWAQQLQRPAQSPQPATQSSPATAPTTLPENPSRRVQSGAIPQTGPSTPTRPAPSVPATQPTPAATPVPVRDAQGRIVPNAQPTTEGRARDPVTGQEFQTAPTPTRPR